jgi:hypothetical protein
MLYMINFVVSLNVFAVILSFSINAFLEGKKTYGFLSIILGNINILIAILIASGV